MSLVTRNFLRVKTELSLQTKFQISIQFFSFIVAYFKCQLHTYAYILTRSLLNNKSASLTVVKALKLNLNERFIQSKLFFLIRPILVE